MFISLSSTNNQASILTRIKDWWNKKQEKLADKTGKAAANVTTTVIKKSASTLGQETGETVKKKISPKK
jgi:hypothetical protein